MDLVETEYVETKTVTGIYIFLSLLFSIYAMSTLVCSIWGTSVVPKNCLKSDLRYALRGLMVTSVMSFIAYISYGICIYSCREVAQGGSGGTKLVVDTELSLPTWILLFTLSTAIANLYFLVVMNNGFTNSGDCSSGSVQTFQNYLKFCIATTSLIITVIVVIFGYRIYKNPQARKIKSEAQTRYNQAIKSVSLTTRKDEEGMKNKISEKQKQIKNLQKRIEKAKKDDEDRVNQEKLREEDIELEKQLRLLQKQFEVQNDTNKMNRYGDEPPPLEYEKNGNIKYEDDSDNELP